MFKITALAVMLLGLMVSSSAADTAQLRGSRALDIDDGDRALGSDDGERALTDDDGTQETLYPSNPDGRQRDRDDPCWYAAAFLDPGCYSWRPTGGRDRRRRGCYVKVLKEEEQDCPQGNYGYKTCSRVVCSKSRRQYSKKCGRIVPAYDGQICVEAIYKLGAELNKCVTPYTCYEGRCAPCSTDE